MLKIGMNLLLATTITTLLITPTLAQENWRAQCEIPDFDNVLVRAEEAHGTVNEADFLGALSEMMRMVEQKRMACLSAAVEHEVELHEIDLSNAILPDIDLGGAQLQGAVLTSTTLRRANLTDANLQGALLIEADLMYAMLHGVDLRGADLTDANLQGADLTDALFDDTTVMPDGKPWQSSTTTARFSDPDSYIFWRSQNVRSPAYDGIEDFLFEPRWYLQSAKDPPEELPADCAVPDFRILGFPADADDAITDPGISLAMMGAITHLLMTTRRSCLEACIDAAFDVEGDADMQSVSFYTLDLNGLDLSYADLREISLAHLTLTDANLREARLQGATFDFVSFSRLNLSGASLQGAIISDSEGTHNDLRNVNLQGADLRALWLMSTDMRNVNLQGAYVLDSDFNRSDLTGADLRNAVIDRCKMDRTILRQADLRGAYIRSPWDSLLGMDTQTTFREVDLRAANLQEAGFDAVQLIDADLSGADLRGAAILRSSLEDANLSAAQLQGTVFFGSDLRGADFSRAKFDTNTILPDASSWAPGTDMAQFTYPNHANFWRGYGLRKKDLQGHDFNGANLRGAIMVQTNLQEADLRGANLAQSSLAGANLIDALLDETTILPDGTYWTPDTDMARFTNPDHDDFFIPFWIQK